MGYTSTLYTNATITLQEDTETTNLINEINTILHDPKHQHIKTHITNQLTTTNPNTYITELQNTKTEWAQNLCYLLHFKPDPTINNQIQIQQGNSGKAYTINEDLIQLIEYLKTSNATLNGEIVREGEDVGDAERWVIKNNTITLHEKAELTWPSDNTKHNTTKYQ